MRLPGASSGVSRRQHHRQISISGDANEAVFLRVFRFNSFFRTVGVSHWVSADPIMRGVP